MIQLHNDLDGVELEALLEDFAAALFNPFRRRDTSRDDAGKQARGLGGNLRTPRVHERLGHFLKEAAQTWRTQEPLPRVMGKAKVSEGSEAVGDGLGA